MSRLGDGFSDYANFWGCVVGVGTAKWSAWRASGEWRSDCVRIPDLVVFGVDDGP
jgi:hypothetical protein